MGEGRIFHGHPKALSTKAPIRVGYIAAEPTPFRVPHLDLIADRPEIDLNVVYAAASVQGRGAAPQHRHRVRILRGPKLPTTRLLHHELPLTPQIWPLLNRERFDVLVIAGWSLPATLLAMAWARRHDVPYLLVSENHSRERRPRWISALRRFVLPHLVGPAAATLPTGTLAREHLVGFGARFEDAVFFPNTVDVAEVARCVEGLRPERSELRAALGVSEGELILLYVGRFIGFKAVDDMIRAAARVTEPVCLVLVGTGPLEDDWRQLAASLGVRATFPGWQEREELLRTYAAADVFVLPSRREPWGTVVVEAAAAGLPIIATDVVGAAADLVVDGGNGRIVGVGDVAAQAAAIEELAADPELRARYGRCSRELAARWGYDRSIDEFVAAVKRAAR